MIPEFTICCMTVLAVVMFIYSLYDNANRLYANIPLGVVSGIILLYLGQVIATGAAEFKSASLGDILSLVGFVALGYSLFMAVDVIFEAINAEPANESQEEE
jgi:xanthine/uracil permease